MRVWLDRDALAARGLTVGDVAGRAARARTSTSRPAGSNRPTRDFTLRVDRSFGDAADFAAAAAGAAATTATSSACAKSRGSSWARVERRAYYRTNGKSQVGLGIVKTSTANDLAVAEAAKKEVERDQPHACRQGMQIAVTYDATEFIDVAVHEVYKTLAEAIVLVLLVIWLFLGSARAALVPAVTVPVCVMAAFMPLLAVRLLDQPADLAGAGAVDRPGGRRRDRGAGKHPAPRRPRRAGAAGGAARHPPGRLRGDRDDRGAGRGVPADRVPGRQQRPPVPRAGGGAGRRGRDLVLRRADA